MGRAWLLLAILLLPPPLLAESEIYGGVGIGFSSLEIKQGGLVIGPPFAIAPTELSRDIKDSGIATKEYVGARYGQYVGLELGYIRFGSVTDDVAVLVPPFGFPDRVQARIRLAGFDVSLAGFYPLNQDFSLFAKAGTFRWNADFLANGVKSFSDEGWDMVYALGGELRAGARVRMRIEAQYYDVEFADTTWSLTASVQYRIPLGR